jgi:hypothetical protein
MANSNTAHSRALRKKTSAKATKEKIDKGIYKKISVILCKKSEIDFVNNLNISVSTFFKKSLEKLDENGDIKNV